MGCSLEQLGLKRTGPHRRHAPQLDMATLQRQFGAAVNVSSVSNINHEDLDKPIIGTYSVDYNIVNLDTSERKRLEVEKSGAYGRLREITDLLQKYEHMLNVNQTYLERKQTIKQKDELIQEYNHISSGQKINEYNERTNYLVKEYTTLGIGFKWVSIDGKSSKESTDDDVVDTNRERRLEIIAEFIKIANNYTPLSIHKDIDKNPYCRACSTNLKDVPIESSGHQICPNCNANWWVSINHASLKDNSVTNVTKSNNTDRDNFHRGYRKFICLQGEDKLPDGWRLKLDDYYLNKKKKPQFVGEYVQHQPITYRRYRGGTTPKMLFKALSECGMTDHYGDVNLIGHLYWGWDIPQAEHLESLVMQIYDETQEILDSLPAEERDRSSSLGVQYRLFKTLEMLGFDCKRYEFRIAEMQDSIENHERLWKIMCEGANRKNSSIIYIPTMDGF